MDAPLNILSSLEEEGVIGPWMAVLESAPLWAQQIHAFDGEVEPFHYHALTPLLDSERSMEEHASLLASRFELVGPTDLRRAGARGDSGQRLPNYLAKPDRTAERILDDLNLQHGSRCFCSPTGFTDVRMLAEFRYADIPPLRLTRQEEHIRLWTSRLARRRRLKADDGAHYSIPCISCAATCLSHIYCYIAHHSQDVLRHI